MNNKKGNLGFIRRGQSNIISILVITVLAIVAVVILWQITQSLIEKNKEDINLDKLSNSININEKSSFIDSESGLFQLQITRRADDININKIQIVANSKEKTLNYIINDYPKSLETKNYLLNISDIKNADEILVYPVLEAGDFGFGERLIVSNLDENKGEIDAALEIINPIIINGSQDLCLPEFNCGEWDECHVTYALEDIIEQSVVLEGIQERKCIDNNKCTSDVYEKKNCETKIEIEVKKIKIQECDKEYLEISDANSRELISRLELIEGKLNIQFLLSDATKYYPYCFNRMQDCDEDGIDCVNEESGKNSCKFCE